MIDGGTRPAWADVILFFPKLSVVHTSLIRTYVRVRIYGDKNIDDIKKILFLLKGTVNDRHASDTTNAWNTGLYAQNLCLYLYETISGKKVIVSLSWMKWHNYEYTTYRNVLGFPSLQVHGTYPYSFALSARRLSVRIIISPNFSTVGHRSLLYYPHLLAISLAFQIRNKHNIGNFTFITFSESSVKRSSPYC